MVRLDWRIVDGGENVAAKGWEGGRACCRRERNGRRRIVGISTEHEEKFL